MRPSSPLTTSALPASKAWTGVCAGARVEANVVNSLSTKSSVVYIMSRCSSASTDTGTEPSTSGLGQVNREPSTYPSSDRRMKRKHTAESMVGEARIRESFGEPSKRDSGVRIHARRCGGCSGSSMLPGWARDAGRRRRCGSGALLAPALGVVDVRVFRVLVLLDLWSRFFLRNNPVALSRFACAIRSGTKCWPSSAMADGTAMHGLSKRHHLAERRGGSAAFSAIGGPF